MEAPFIPYVPSWQDARRVAHVECIGLVYVPTDRHKIRRYLDKLASNFLKGEDLNRKRVDNLKRY